MPAAGAYRPHVEKMSRQQLEDEYYKMYESNQNLKRKLNETEEKLKKCAFLSILVRMFTLQNCGKAR